MKANNINNYSVDALRDELQSSIERTVNDTSKKAYLEKQDVNVSFAQNNDEFIAQSNDAQNSGLVKSILRKCRGKLSGGLVQEKITKLQKFIDSKYQD